MAVGSIASTASLVEINIDPSGPVADLILAVAILTWSVPPLVRWRRLTWTKRLAAVGGIVFTAGLMMRFIEPTKLVVGGRILLIVAILIWSVLWCVLPLIRWRRLTWTKRLAAVGGIVFTAGLISLIESTKLVGFPILAVAISIWSVLPLVRWRRLAWAKRLLAVAATVFGATGAVALFSQTDPVSLLNIVGLIIWALLYLALLSYFGTMLSRATASPVAWVLIALGVIFLYSFPPLLAFLATNGGASFAHLLLQQVNAGLNWLGILQNLLLILVPVLLIVLPEILRRKLVGAEKSATLETLLPNQLAFAAALATGLYAITLHFAKGPLAKVSANQLAFAALAVVVLLNPFYKFIVTACWKHGIADVFDPRNWLTKQKELVKLLREAFAVPIEDVTPDGSANHATVPPRAEVDTTTSNPGLNQT